ncbi:ribosomal protein L11 methyltransferase [Aquifex aeolicus VF5]|uniref:Ribosomal protein L11 methyltransferase n=2 Tax=Aquifex aeolicus TaxID=63363 RepID=PRMA_AQUAE|nr:RecName: Full=Ribosomal protein L11 methyltransferase; Short=L11 Mtase [Aquifex aeolicus VF5]AAC07828.1 ribosomal protein L11 methyltransferase [Aquifex aeolicus VF5]
MMKIKRFVYSLPEEEFYELVYSQNLSVEVLERKEIEVIFASYKEIEGLTPEKVEEVKEDWENWKEKFKPIEVEDFVIIPSWKKPVIVKPGLAFGTGLHPTTQLCIKALKKYLKEGMTVLDVGTGSGILAIVSALLGAKRVVGIDIDEKAVNECRENAELNKVKVECFRAEPKDVNESFDLVVANLEIHIFERVLKDILPKFKKIGIFSGLYKEKDLKRFEELLGGLKVKEVFEKENWYAVVVEKG